jgi:predicted amidohydrolase YtcJ
MTPDTLITNANTLTQNPDDPVAQALAIAGGRIVAVGTDDEIRHLAGPGTRVLDMGGRTVAPGFNDSHMHVLPYGVYLGQADLSPAAGVRDARALAQTLRRWADANPQSEWALGNRYDQNVFPGAKHPTRQDLDALFPQQPVFVVQTSAHAGACNSAALKRAGITRDTPDPDGGKIVRDASGEPTGVLLESAAELVTSHISPPTRAEMVAAIRRANNALARVGITAATDLSLSWFDTERAIAAYKQAVEEGAPVRMTIFPCATAFGRPEDAPSRNEFAAAHGLAIPPLNPPLAKGGNGGVRLGPVKLFSDGALTTRTAALHEPFIDGSGSGMLLHEPEELQAYIVAAHRGGWQIATHAIGDRAIELVLDCYAEASTLTPDPSPFQGEGRRHRIEHAMLLDEGLIDRLVEQKVIPTMQPEFIARLGDAYVLGLGEERAARINPYASVLGRGIPLPFGSDCPVVPGDPLDGIRAAVRRTTPSGRALGPNERISVPFALLCYTFWSAYSTFDEREIGSIEPGKRADLAVLSADSMADDLDSVRVVATLIGGEVVYGAEELN